MGLPSMPKFTDGPWIIDAMGNIWSNDTKICDMRKHPPQSDQYRKKTDEEHEANRRLIAASPLLFDRLERALDMLEDYALDYKHVAGSSEIHPMHKRIIDDVKAAIAMVLDDV